MKKEKGRKKKKLRLEERGVERKRLIMIEWICSGHYL